MKENDEGADSQEEEEIGVPETLKFKRRYTMSPEAMAQRKAAANSPAKAEAMKGNRNNWKHGLYAQGFVRTFLKPCKSTCGDYPCDLIEDGRTAPGGECLDKEQVIQTFEAIMRALSDEDKKTRFEALHEIMALHVGGSMQVVRNLLEDVLRDGTILKKNKYSKDGAYLGYEVVPHPSLLTLPKLIDALGLSLSELNVTPKAQSKIEDDEKAAETLASMLSRVGRNLQQAPEGKQG